jgi:hypothetical protein
MRDKIALEEHVSTEAMNALWDDAGAAAPKPDPGPASLAAGHHRQEAPR